MPRSHGVGFSSWQLLHVRLQGPHTAIVRAWLGWRSQRVHVGACALQNRVSLHANLEHSPRLVSAAAGALSPVSSGCLGFAAGRGVIAAGADFGDCMTDGGDSGCDSAAWLDAPCVPESERMPSRRGDATDPNLTKADDADGIAARPASRLLPSRRDDALSLPPNEENVARFARPSTDAERGSSPENRSTDMARFTSGALRLGGPNNRQSRGNLVWRAFSTMSAHATWESAHRQPQAVSVQSCWIPARRQRLGDSA